MGECERTARWRRSRDGVRRPLLDCYDAFTHFAPRSLLLVGYDEGADPTEAPDADADAGTGVVYTSDSEFETVRTPPLSRSRTARSSDAVVPLSNRYPVPEGDPTIDTAEATERAIRAAATYVVDPGETSYPLVPGATYGAAGIRALAEVEATLYGNALAALDQVRTYPS